MPASMALMLSASGLPGQVPIRLHPGNGHYFEFRDRPVVLVGSSEHYGALINLDFDYNRYFDTVAASNLNLVRIFSGTYRETAGSFNIPDNTLNPAPGRSISPWKRSTTPGARDGGNKFDLNQWDPAYFLRLRDFVAQAGVRGIVVELTLFSAIYDDGLWNFSPMNSQNHINSVGGGGRLNFYNTGGDLLSYQKALTRKCAAELAGFDNVIFEICNEPYIVNVPPAWERALIDELVAAESALPQRHLIAQNVYNYQGVISNPHPGVSLFNFHYAYPAAATQNYGLNRSLGDDETGFAGQADFPYRREAWEFMLSGGGLFNHLDYSFTASREDGTAVQAAPGGGGPGIRRQLGILRGFLEGLPLVDLAPQPGLIAGGVPSGGAARAIGTPGVAYGIYLRGGSQANLVLNLPAGSYRSEWIDTKTGESKGVTDFIHPGGPRVLASPAYSEDIVLRVIGQALPPEGPQLLVNGDFEAGYQGWTPTGNQAIQASSGDSTKQVAFNDNNRPPDGVLKQTFATVPGATHSLTFDAGVIAFNTNEQHLDIRVDGNGSLVSQVVSLRGLGNGATLWIPSRFTFVADTALTTLTFSDDSTLTQNLDLLLANVRVTGPATIGTATISGTPGAIALSLPAAQPGSYILERSDNFLSWQQIDQKSLTTAGTVDFLDSEPPPPGGKRRFYRIGLLAD